MSTPTESPSAAADPDPVQEARAHLEQAKAALDRLREVLPSDQHAPARHGRR